MLRPLREIEVLGEAPNAADGVELIRRTRPNLVVLDPPATEARSIEVIQAIRTASRETEILVFASSGSPQAAYDALRAGARGYVTEWDPIAEFIAAVQSVCQRESFLAQRFRRRRTELPDPASVALPTMLLTKPEIEVLKLLASGRHEKEIVRVLHISKQEVESHRREIMRKVGLNSFAELVRFAIRSNLIAL